MKVLITYLSQTGNTKQIAEAIHQEASGSHEADLKTVEEISADDFAGYDLVFVGSPIHGNGLAGPISELMNALPDGPSFKLAGFVTHASSAYEKEGFDQGMQSLEDISTSKNIAYLGVFDCEGRIRHWRTDSGNVQADKCIIGFPKNPEVDRPFWWVQRRHCFVLLTRWQTSTPALQRCVCGGPAVVHGP